MHDMAQALACDTMNLTYVFASRPAARIADSLSKPGLCSDLCRSSGAGHRSEYGHLQRGSLGDSDATSLHRRLATGVCMGTFSEHARSARRTHPGCTQELCRMEAPEHGLQ